MAAAALPVAQIATDAAEKAAEATAAQVRKFSEDPVAYVGKVLRTLGAISTVAGVLAYIGSLAATRAANGFLADIDGVLGIPQETAPTPPRKAPVPVPPPAPPAYVSLFNQIVTAVSAPDSANAQLAVSNLQAAIRTYWALAIFEYGAVQTGTNPGPHGTTFPAYTYSQTPPTVAGTENSPTPTNGGQQSVYAIVQTAAIINYLQGFEPDWDPSQIAQLSPQNGPLNSAAVWNITQNALIPYRFAGSDSISNWAAAQGVMGSGTEGDNLKTTLNGWAQCLGLTVPFDLSTSSSQPWGPLGAVVQTLASFGEAVENVGSTIEGDVAAVGQGLAGVAVDIGTAVTYIGRGLLNLPRLAFDGLGFTFYWSAEMVLDYLYGPLIVAGVAMLAGSVALLNVYPVFRAPISARLKLATAAAGARFGALLDRPLKVRENVVEAKEERDKESVILSVTEPPAALPALVISEPVVVPTDAPADLGPVMSPPPVLPGPGAEEPAPQTPTEETEALLGESPNIREKKMQIAAGTETEGAADPRSIGDSADVPSSDAPGVETPTSEEMVPSAEPPAAPAPPETERELTADDLLSAASSF